MSKLFLRSLYLMLLTLCLPSMASAENVAKIGSTEYATLQEAFEKVADGQTVEITVAGTYTLPSISKNITIQGDVDGVVFNCVGAANTSIASIPNGATFKNVTLNMGNVDYHGFQHAGTINMEGCKLIGRLSSYGNMNFTNCKFVQNDGDYHMWVYGGDNAVVNYTGCTFTNETKGKFINVYSESNKNKVTVNISGCTFINNGTASKAAVNLKSTSGSNPLAYTVNIDAASCSTVGAFPTAETSDADIYYNAFIQVDDVKAGVTDANSVTVDNVTIYEDGATVEVVEINTVEEFKAFRDAVNSGTSSGTSYAGKIVRLMADLDLSSEDNWTPIGNLAAYPGQSFKGTFDGNGHIISNLTVNDNTPNYAVAALFGSIEKGSIVNLTVKDVNITSTHFAAGIVAYTSNTPSIINCHVVGGTITSTPELVGSSYDNGDKAGGIMGYCTAGTTIKDCTVEGVTITAYRDLAGICGYADGAVTDCTVKDVTVVQDNTNGYKTEDVAYTACEVVGGRSANATATNAANTTENVTVKTVVPVAKIGTTQYETLQAAIDAAQAGDVVELLKDFDLTTVTTTPSNKYNVNINKSITIDGKGYKVTSSAGKRAIVLTEEGNNITLKNLTVVNNKAEACLWIANNLTCTLDAVTLDGTNGKTYNQPLTIGSIDDEGRVTLNVTNGSVIKTNDAGSAHYAILAAHPADITVTNSSLIGWANVYLKPDAAGSTVNISNSTLKSQGIAGASASNNFSMFTTESGNNTITLTDNNISLTPAADTYMTLVTFNGTANNTVKVQGDQTTFTTTNVTRGGITHSKGDLENNTVSFDEDAHTAFAEAINVLKNEGVSDTEAEGVYTLGYVAEVYYYWIVSGAETGGNYDFAEPFKNGWLDNGEFIRLRKDVTLSENLTWAKENASFTLTFGEYSVTKGEYSVALKTGVTVNTDKQTDIFTAADAANYTVTETEDNGTYTYTVTERPDVAQIGDVKYKSLAAAVAAVPTDGTQTTITMIADETIVGNNGATIAATQNVILDLNGKTVTLNVAEAKASQLITNKGTLTITDSSQEQNGKLTNAAADGLDVGSWPSNNYVTAVINNNGTLNIEAGTIQSTANGSICYAIDNNNTSYDAVLNIKGGYLTSVGTVVRQFCNSTTKQNVLNISGGKVITNGYTAIWTQLPGSDSASKKLATLNITGGEISGSTYAWYDYSYGDSFEAVDYSISGGSINGYIYSYAVNNGVKEGFISGGTFSKDPSAYVADGYVGTDNGDGTFSVTEDTYVAQIGTTKYASLAEAVAAATDGQTVTLLADVTLTDRLFVNAGATPAYAGTGNRYATTTESKSITLELDGHNITSSSNIALAGGSLNITNTGTADATHGVISTSEAGLAPVEVRGTGDLTAKRTLTVGEGVTLTGSTYGLNVFGSNNDKKNIIDVNVNGTVNGTLFVLGNLKNAENEININVNGTISVPNNDNNSAEVGIALNGNATVTVYEGANVSGETGIEVRAGKLVVNGGTITATASTYSYTANNSGSSTKGAAIAVAQHSTKLPIATTLNGGTLTGGEKTLVVEDAQNNDLSSVEVTATESFTQSAVIPEGFKWEATGENTYTLVEATDIELANNGDNSAVITAANGKVRNVTLKGRTLYKDNCWNTICLPFDVTIDAESPLAGATVKELDAANSGYVAATKVLRINFKDAETDNDGNVVLKANTPYLLKWTSGNNVVAPVFNGVTVESGEAKAVSSDGELEFVGTASTVTLEGTKYAYFGNNNKLLYVDAPTGKKIYTCRAYFYLPNQDFKAALDETSGAKSFVLSFGDDDDDITRVAAVAGQQKAEDDVYYDLQGRKIVGQPTVSGIYVKNGVKVYVK